MSKEYRLTLTQTYLSATCNNVFYYTSPSNLLTQADNVCAAFSSTILGLLAAVQNVGAVSTQLYAIDLNTGTDYHTLTVSQAGLMGDANGGLPRFTAWGFRYTTTGSLIRYGYKRFAGIDETAQEQGLPTSGTLTNLNTLAAALEDPITDGGFTFSPIIVRFTNDSPPVVDFFTSVTTCSFQRITHQTSRQ